eukprot:Ihof_evm1s955 gene=Ihof_evmTU1s955
MDNTEPALVHLAAANGSTKTLEELLREGGNPMSKDATGDMPIHICVINGRTACLRVLVAYHADVNAFDHNQCTPLHWAVYTGHLECVQVLVENGANPTLLDGFGRSPLDWANQYGTVPIEMMKLLQQSEPRCPPTNILRRQSGSTPGSSMIRRLLSPSQEIGDAEHPHVQPQPRLETSIGGTGPKTMELATVLDLDMPMEFTTDLSQLQSGSSVPLLPISTPKYRTGPGMASRYSSEPVAMDPSHSPPRMDFQGNAKTRYDRKPLELTLSSHAQNNEVASPISSEEGGVTMDILSRKRRPLSGLPTRSGDLFTPGFDSDRKLVHDYASDQTILGFENWIEKLEPNREPLSPLGLGVVGSLPTLSPSPYQRPGSPVLRKSAPV